MAAEGWLVVDGVEVFSNYRFKKMVDYFQNAGLIDSSSIQFRKDGYPAIAPGVKTCPSTWAYNPTTDRTNLPWYNANLPESQKLIGFWVEGIDGLDARAFERQVVQKAYSGGQVTQLRSQHRELNFEFIVLGVDSEGVEFGMRWLESQFVNFCSNCQLSEIQLRHNDPIAGSPERGWWKYERAGLLGGIEWDAEEIDIGCRARRASLNLVVADPCRYKCEETVFAATEVLASGGYTPETCMSAEDWIIGFDPAIPPKLKKKVGGSFEATQRYVYAEIPASGVGVNSAVVRITNTDTSASGSCNSAWNVWVTCRSDWTSEDEAIANRRTVLTAINLPASGQMVIDSAQKLISVNVNGVEVDHPWQYVAFQDSASFDWIDCSDCSQLWVGLAPDTPGAISATFQVDYVHREGCV
jgi:hypothetical protein